MTYRGAHEGERDRAGALGIVWRSFVVMMSIVLGLALAGLLLLGLVLTGLWWLNR